MTIRIAILSAVATLVFMLSSAVDAGVAEDCQPGASKDASHACNNYLEGFISGALLTDAAIIQSLASAEGSDFMDRAYRTRLGQKPVPPTFLAAFCLPEVPMPELIADIRKHMVGANPQRDLGDLVYGVLKQHYPC